MNKKEKLKAAIEQLENEWDDNDDKGRCNKFVQDKIAKLQLELKQLNETPCPACGQLGCVEGPKL